MSGTNSQSITVNAEENDSSLRIGKIFISDSQSDAIDSIVVVQDSNVVTSIHEINLPEQINVYPNPSDGELTIEIPEDLDRSILKLRLVSMLGSEVKLPSLISSGNKYVVDLHDYAKGIYFLRIEYNGDVVTKKISLIK